MTSKNLPIDQVVDVTITREGVSPASSNFSNLLYIGVNDSQSNPKIPRSERVREFVSSAAVGNLFGTDSDIYKGASAYFGQSPSPSEILIALRYGGINPPPTGFSKALGNSVAFDIDSWKAITTGAFSFTYNSVVITLQNLDFSSVKSVYDIVDIINGHFNAFNSNNPNVSLSYQSLAVVGENVWTDTKGEAWADLEGSYWITHVAPTGELRINYDENSSSFYITSSISGRDFVSGTFGAASFGTDITISNLLNLQSAVVQLSQMSGSRAVAESEYSVTDLTSIKAVVNGSLTLNNVVTDNLDFSNVSDIQEVAAVLSLHIGTAFTREVSVNVVDSKLYIQAVTGTDFSDSLVITATTLSPLLFGEQTKLSIVADFLETASQALTAAASKNNAFYGVAAQRTPNGTISSINSEVLKLAETVQSMTKMYFALLYDQTIYSSNKTDIGSTLSDKSLFRTVPCAVDALSDGFIDCAAAGSLLTQVAGSSTLFGNQLATITASNQGVSGQNYALAKGVNVQSLIGNVSIFRNGTVAQLSPEYADVIRGVDWLKNEIEVNVFAAIAGARKIPYTDTGVNILKGQLKLALDLAVLNGLIADNIDSQGNVVPAYTITSQRVADVPTAQRKRRVAPTINFSATLAGAIQHVTISGTVSV